jgi:hypothetical protein
MAYLCSAEATKLRTELERVALVAGEAMTTISKQARIGGGGRRTDPEVPLPVNLTAAADHDAAVNTLTTWARHVHEESGRPLPEVRTAPCLHPTCAERRYGPPCAGEPPEHPIAVLATWLGGQLDWLRHRPEAEEAFDEIGDACRVLVRVVDRAADRIIVGQCGCGEYLYAVRGREHVTCAGCNTQYNVEAARDLLRESLDQRLCTAAEIALLAAYLGLAGQRDAIRHKITVWADRGLVVRHSEIRGEPAYVFGEVVARLMAG